MVLDCTVQNWPRPEIAGRQANMRRPDYWRNMKSDGLLTPGAGIAQWQERGLPRSRSESESQSPLHFPLLFSNSPSLHRAQEVGQPPAGLVRVAAPERLQLGDAVNAEVAEILAALAPRGEDRKSTRLNSSHLVISYA